MLTYREPLMSTELLLALAAFAFVTSITPGPNNLMLLTSGLHFGFGRSIPHMAGISLGFVVMLLLVGVGISAVFAAAPWLYQVMRVLSLAYMLWLAWRIA